MAEIGDFGAIVLAIAGGVMLALLARTLSERFPIPAPALFLVAAAATPVLLPDIRTVERIGVVALIVILFDGGMLIGWRRFRRAALPIASLGILVTIARAAVLAAVAHYLFDFNWTTAWILGAALAPTDPAVMFSILGDKQIRGRTGTILEGEAGVNDPV
jgi:cell volume regulation protein A